MERNRIDVSSITYAIRGRDLLRKRGFKAYIERTTANSPEGCGYSIVVEGDINYALEILKASGLKMRGGYEGRGYL